MSVDLHTLVLPAFESLPSLPSEVAPWETAYDLDTEVSIPGAPAPLRHDGDIGVLPTGVGKAAAASTVASVCATLDLTDTLVFSVGVAGGPPSLPIGSVVIAETILDWDLKCRFDDGSPPLASNPYVGEQGRYELDEDHVDTAYERAAHVQLDTEGDQSPIVTTGTNVCGDELWHGRELAETVEWLVAERNCPSYRVTEMEDAGTATALERFGYLDQYLSIRGIANHDRPTGDTSARASFFDPTFEAGFERSLANAVTVARAVVEPAHSSR